MTRPRTEPARPPSRRAGRASIWPGFAVVAVAGAAMLALDVRTINRYD